MRLLFSLALMLFYLLTSILLAAPALKKSSADLKMLEEIPNIKWKKSLGDKKYSYQTRGTISVSKEGKVVLAGTYFTSKEGNSQKNPEGIWVWMLNPDGKLLLDLKFGKNYKQSEKVVDVEAITVLGAGKIALVTRNASGTVTLRTLTRDGKIASALDLVGGFHATKILETSMSGLILLGYNSKNSAILRISKTGKIEIPVLNDSVKHELYVDGVILDKKNILTLENSGKQEQFFMTDSIVKLNVIDYGGGSVKQVEFPGRHGRLAELKTGNYAVVYDRSETIEQDFKVAGLDSNLNALWESGVASNKLGFQGFSIASYKQYLVTFGQKNNRPVINSFDNNGIKKWSFFGKGYSPGVSFTGVCSKFMCYSISTVISVLDQNRINNKIMVVGFFP